MCFPITTVCFLSSTVCFLQYMQVELVGRIFRSKSSLRYNSGVALGPLQFPGLESAKQSEGIPCIASMTHSRRKVGLSNVWKINQTNNENLTHFKGYTPHNPLKTWNCWNLRETHCSINFGLSGVLGSIIRLRGVLSSIILLRWV